MITVKPFSLEIIKTHKCFYLLRNIVNIEEIEILHNTPAGHIRTGVGDAFMMPNGRIIVAFRDQLNIAAMHNLVVIGGSKTENINLVPLERVIDIYDRPVDAQVGVFTFTNSDMILAPNLDWRCDNGKFGPRSFHPITIMDDLPEIVVYEPMLSVNSVGHIIYIEGVGKQTLANHHLNEDEYPVTGRTLWETLKLVREWAIVNDPPFNNSDPASLKARLFMKELQFTDAEISVIDSQIPMQIANYLTGSTNARQRPEGVLPITKEVKQLLFSRIASGTISALEYMNPGMWDVEELVAAEKTQLDIDKLIFETLKQSMAPDAPVVSIQNRFFANKQLILNKVAADQL